MPSDTKSSSLPTIVVLCSCNSRLSAKRQQKVNSGVAECGQDADYPLTGAKAHLLPCLPNYTEETRTQPGATKQ